jgi:hypothetical protein
MQQVILEQLPLIVACVAILSGAFLGKYLLNKIQNRKPLTWIAYGVLIGCFVFGPKLVGVMIGVLLQGGIQQPTAACLSIGLLSFLSGLGLAFMAGSRLAPSK